MIWSISDRVSNHINGSTRDQILDCLGALPELVVEPRTLSWPSISFLDPLTCLHQLSTVWVYIWKNFLARVVFYLFMLAFDSKFHQIFKIDHALEWQWGEAFYQVSWWLKRKVERTFMLKPKPKLSAKHRLSVMPKLGVCFMRYWIRLRFLKYLSNLPAKEWTFDVM